MVRKSKGRKIILHYFPKAGKMYNLKSENRVKRKEGWHHNSTFLLKVWRRLFLFFYTIFRLRVMLSFCFRKNNAQLFLSSLISELIYYTPTILINKAISLIYFSCFIYLLHVFIVWLTTISLKSTRVGPPYGRDIS